MFVGRLCSAIIGATMISMALTVSHLGGAEKVAILWATLIVGPLMAPTVWGLLSAKVGARAVWITVATSLAAGMALKSSISHPDISRFLPGVMRMWAWPRMSDRGADLTIGVIIPIVVLTLVHLTASKTDGGWKRMAEFVSRRAQTTDATDSRAVDALPAMAIAIAVAIGGLSILALMPFNPGYRLSLGEFGGAVLILGGGLWCAARRVGRQKSVVDNSKPGTSSTGEKEELS